MEGLSNIFDYMEHLTDSWILFDLIDIIRT